MSKTDLIVNDGFASELLAQLPDLDADSPLRKVDLTESSVKFLPKFSVNMQNQFVMKTKDGDVKIKEESLPMVIHHMHPTMYRVYYDGPFDAKNPSAPACGSNDEISPDESAQDPQHTRCDTCPRKAEKTCKLKQRIIVSQKVEGGEPTLMTMDLNVTSVLNREDESEGWFGFKRYAQNIAKANRNIYNFVTEMRVSPDGFCKLQFKPIGVVADESDPNLVAHRKTKEALDFDEVCRVDFAPWESKDSESTVDTPAPEAKIKSKPTVKEDSAEPEMKASKADVKEWLNKDKK